jgi:hypothetical protein
MAARKPKTSEKGTLIRGADGSLYHIPDSALKAYRLPDQLTGDARKLMDRKGLKAKGAHLPAVRASGLVCKAPAKAPYMVAPKPGVMVKGKKAVMVKAGKAVMVKGQKPYMVNVSKLKRIAKGKR